MTTEKRRQKMMVKKGDVISIRVWVGEDTQVRAATDELPDDGTRWNREVYVWWSECDAVPEKVLVRYDEDKEVWLLDS